MQSLLGCCQEGYTDLGLICLKNERTSPAYFLYLHENTGVKYCRRKLFLACKGWGSEGTGLKISPRETTDRWPWPHQERQADTGDVHLKGRFGRLALIQIILSESVRVINSAEYLRMSWNSSQQVDISPDISQFWSDKKHHKNRLFLPSTHKFFLQFLVTFKFKKLGIGLRMCLGKHIIHSYVHCIVLITRHCVKLWWFVIMLKK